MAIITVTTAADVVASDGVRSLREAVALANANAASDTIGFAAALEGKTLTLTGGELVVAGDVTIDGDKDNDGSEVTLSGGNLSRILHCHRRRHGRPDARPDADLRQDAWG